MQLIILPRGIKLHTVQHEGVTHGDQVGGLLGGHDAGHARGFDDIALADLAGGPELIRDRLTQYDACFGACRAQRRCLGAHIDHAGLSGL